jgi:hypothetical protein
MLEGCCELKSQHAEFAACGRVCYAAPQVHAGLQVTAEPT